MAAIKFPRKEFEKHVKLTKEIEEKMSSMGTHFEQASDTELEVEVTPNRPDLLSLQGYLRSFLRFIGKKSDKVYKIQKSGCEIRVDRSVEKIRPYCMAAIVKGVKFDDEKIRDIMQWQEKIHATVGRNRKKVALGYYILDKIKFPVRYLAKEPKDIIFEPLDMAEKMNALQILQRHPTGREYANQLEGKDKFPVYYDANNEVLSMPPIINSNNSGKISVGTTDILIECSGTDLSTLKKVTTMAVADLIDMGGKAYSVDIIYENKKESIDFKPEEIKISLENTNKLLGLSLKDSNLKNLLEKMGHVYKSGKALVPAWRVDIMHEVDIIEDIAIAYGYDKFKPEIPEIATAGEESMEWIAKKKICEILNGLGMLEISSYHLAVKEDIKLLGQKAELEVENSKTDYKILRPNLLSNVLKTLSENIDKDYPQKIFEIGSVFSPDETSETGISEKPSLCIALTPANFTDIKQVLEYLGRMIDLELKVEESEHTILIPGRTAKIILSNQEIGILGEVHPSILKKLHIKMPISLLELNLTSILEKFK